MLLSHTSNEEYNLTSNKFEDLLWEEIKVTKPTGYLDKRVVYLDFHQYLTFEINFTKWWAVGVRACDGCRVEDDEIPVHRPLVTGSAPPPM